MSIQNKRKVEDPTCPNLDWEGECDRCGKTVSRFRGEGDVDCECGAMFNCFGQRLRDDLRSRPNPSEWDDDIGDMEGYEMAMLRGEE